MMLAKKNKKDVEVADRKTEKVCFLLAEKYEERIKNVIYAKFALKAVILFVKYFLFSWKNN